MALKFKKLWAEAVFIKRIGYALLKKVPLPLLVSLADGKLSPKELQDLVQLCTTTVAEELSAIASEGLKKLD